MFTTNPVMTHKGIFRQDAEGSWWFLEQRIVTAVPLNKPIPLDSVLNKLISLSEGLKDPELVEQFEQEPHTMMVVGWKEVDKSAVRDIEESMNSYRMTMDPAFDRLVSAEN